MNLKRVPLSQPPTTSQALVHAATFDAACTNLSQFMLVQASASAQLAGFGWEGSAAAPETHWGLLRAFVRCQVTGRPLPVSDRDCDRTIYGGRDGNLAFRFWHDVTHVRLARGFDLDSEIAVGNAQLDVLRAAGFPPGTLEYELLHADTVGQTICGAATGDFPADQTCFARLSLASSLELAIRAQLRADA